jgi:hypothetical protein
LLKALASVLLSFLTKNFNELNVLKRLLPLLLSHFAHQGIYGKHLLKSLLVSNLLPALGMSTHLPVSFNPWLDECQGFRFSFVEFFYKKTVMS